MATEKIIVAASRNKHKIEEIEAITKKFGMSIISRDDAGVPPVEIEEDGETFEENSFKKANEIMKMCGKITLADDSGLMVDYLGGAPGVYSARFAGEDGNDENEVMSGKGCLDLILVDICTLLTYDGISACALSLQNFLADVDLTVCRSVVERTCRI